MTQQTQLTLESAEMLGDLHPFLEQIGSPDGLAALAGASAGLGVSRIGTLADLRTFLQNYHAQILHPFELPAIHRAFTHASRNELRELIALDAQLKKEPLLQNFSAASRQAGGNQLRRLRPLRDARLVQRYIDGVERGEASGWHTIVFGITLAVYSVPLRQGLFSYARQTTCGFIRAAERDLRLSGSDSNSLLAELTETIPASVEAVLATGVAAIRN